MCVCGGGGEWDQIFTLIESHLDKTFITTFILEYKHFKTSNVILLEHYQSINNSITYKSSIHYHRQKIIELYFHQTKQSNHFIQLHK